MESQTKTCQNCKQEFTIESEDFAFYDKIKVPLPTWCPECRMIRRMMFRNQRLLFRRKDDVSGKEILASFPQTSLIKVYEHHYWWSDGWDPMDYEREYDFSRPFFEQFRELLYSVPLFSKSAVNIVNSEYCDQVGWLKNCYLCFDSAYAENSSYLVSSLHIQESMDLYQSGQSELCYECVTIHKSYRTFFSRNCVSCNDIWFSQNLSGCNNCFGCVNIRNKSYYIFNEPYTKEAYVRKLQEYNLGSYRTVEELKKKTHELWEKYPVKYMQGFQNMNADGAYIQNSKNVHASYFVRDSQDIKYGQIIFERTTDCYDLTNFGIDTAEIYESVTTGLEAYGLKFCWECWKGVQEVEYSAYCSSSSNLFGCVGLRKKQYCIFNKQYSEKDFLFLRANIIKHMDAMPYLDKKGRVYAYGEFFPPEFSPFAYNETMAQDLFPLAKDEAETKGFPWRDADPRKFQMTMQAVDLPDNIKDVADSFLKEVIACALCRKAYRIIPTELDFYRKIGLPLPQFCPNCRFIERMKLINPPKFWHGRCHCAGSADDRTMYKNKDLHFHGESHCSNEFETSYAPGRPEIVYCEQCYQTEVV